MTVYNQIREIILNFYKRKRAKKFKAQYNQINEDEIGEKQNQMINDLDDIFNKEWYEDENNLPSIKIDDVMKKWWWLRKYLNNNK